MRAIYIQRRNELKSGFTNKRKEESEVEDDLVGEALPETTDENRDVVKEARGFIFNEHPGVKEKVSDGLEEFLRRTLKEDE